MEDSQIIDLYFARSEDAISETAGKYGDYCQCIAMNILDNREDAEESVSDTWLTAWNHIPPDRPNVLSVFLGRITRNLSIDRWRRKQAFRRGSGSFSMALEELGDCVSGELGPEDAAIRRETLDAIQRFLRGLSPVERSVFVCRYWYLDTSREIAEKSGFSQGKVRTMLRRLRLRLDGFLKQEGLA